ncbi:MAG: serine hydrolase [Phycisphaeraceae bacterium]|nr:serine hydrolase [Phycisphaeraceae bacterium]
MKRALAFLAGSVLAVAIVHMPQGIARQPIAPGPAAADVVIPATPAGKQLAWLVDFLNGKEPLGEIGDRFSENFLKQVPAEKLAPVLNSAKASVFKDGAKLTQIKPGATDSHLVAVMQGGDAMLEVSIDTDASGKMEGLLLKPALPPKFRFDAWPQFDEKLSALPGRTNFAAYAVTTSSDGTFALRPIHTVRPEVCLATGSTFKLYVLGAISEQILAGTAKWDEKIKITEDLKSLPGGVLQDEPAGKELPLSEFAAKMISISDNTATDHLIHRAGRENVEKYAAGFNSCAAQSTPFMTTMEMFRIKLSADKTLASRYAGADEAGRRALLAPGGEVSKSTPDLAFAENWTIPIEIEKVEWFSSANDLCNAMVKLHGFELKPGMDELKRVLRINGGIPFDKKTWPSVAFKGGSEPGVINLTWLLERNDGALFAVSVGWNDPKASVEISTMISLARGMADLLAKEPK